MEVYFGEICAYPFHVPMDNFKNANKRTFRKLEQLLGMSFIFTFVVHGI